MQCDFCHSYRDDTDYYSEDSTVPESLKGKTICWDCFEERYGRCNRCRKVCNLEEIEDEGEPLCQDCLKPKGFPKEIYHAFDASNYCENEAFDSLDAVQKYLDSPEGDWIEERDLTKLTFVKMLSQDQALYEDIAHNKFIVEELDYNGHGYLQRMED